MVLYRIEPTYKLRKHHCSKLLVYSHIVKMLKLHQVVLISKLFIELFLIMVNWISRVSA